MTSDERDEKVNQFLHDAEHAESGMRFARMMNDHAAAKELAEKCARLTAEAKAIDPKRQSPAWAEHAEWVKAGWPNGM